MLATLSSSELLGENSPLANSLKGFIPRQAQQLLAKEIEEAIQNLSILVAEAGTGTGKTFAYLVPTLLADKKVIISTGTKNLQDQLYHRDLPLVKKALVSTKKTALLKGRANYLCLYRLEKHVEVEGLANKALLKDANQINQWAQVTHSGDVAEVDSVKEDSAIWPYVTSTTDNCLGQDCPKAKDCFVLKARRQAQEAQLVVINHHLFFADLSIRDDGFGELLPDAETIIIDEAHQLAETATHFFGSRISSRQIIEMVRDTVAEQLANAPDMPEIRQAAESLQNKTMDMRATLGTETKQTEWKTVAHQQNLQTAITQINEAFFNLQEHLEIAAERSKGLTSCYDRCCLLAELFKQLTDDTPVDQVHWLETFAQSFAIHFTPIDIANVFRDIVEREKKAWIFTSATLAVGNHFQHFTQSLGLEKAKCLQLESPFDFNKQTLLYLPREMPDPRSSHYSQKVCEAAIPVIKASEGRTFILFTSYKALNFAAEFLPKHFDYPILVQGEMPKTELINAFCQLGNAVLLGTNSFWEGVDVRGAALSCVIIDKLPFAWPDDPVLKARINHLKKQGKDPFNEYQVPNAAIILKQGIGRLIRDVNDHGILVICDPRLWSRNYGKTFFASLPTMQITREIHNVENFFHHLMESTL